MANLFTMSLKGLLVAALLFLSVPSQSRVDPMWLKSWKLAVAMQPAEITSHTVLVSPNEPGIPLIVQGQLFEPNGQDRVKHALVHMYHRDHAGFDFGENDNELATWRLQAWAKTDEQGNFSFVTIRPAPDHLGREGGHLHFTVVSSEFGCQWMPKIHFLDDPKISPKAKQRAQQKGQFSPILPVKTIAGEQQINIAFKLKSQADF